jgi:TonB-linked SusC/RagA family outer membrane protein
MDGRFSFDIPEDENVIVVSFIGMQRQEVDVSSQTYVTVLLEPEFVQLDDVVVVGYGQQKKASIVGSITQTTGEVLERSAGVPNVGAALTGNLPGVITMSSSGMPGEENPQILIRSASTWNNSEPLVLVDGIERPLSSVDISSVENISVLKDASATAVFGVKGANGVILVTTKRGKKGAARIDVGGDVILKAPSKLPNKYDSYDALMARNDAIEHELSLNPDSWDYMSPQPFIENYRNQTTVAQRERYPNVDWQDAIFKDYAMSYNANLSVSGGTDFVKYYAAADFIHEGDLFKIWDNGRNYESGYGYNRLNVRSNLDFEITRSTTFKVNIAGSNGAKKSPWGQTNSSDWAVAQQWAGAYNIAPDVFLPKYSDGSWGYYPDISNVSNSAMNLAVAGSMTTTNTQINTDFTLEQNLDFITEGLNFKGLIAWDNTFVETNRGINDLYNDPQQKWIDPETGDVYFKLDYEANNKFDYMQPVLWNIEAGSASLNQKKLYYQLQLDWARSFGNHNLTGMGVFSREENTADYFGFIPVKREDWAFRATYDYNSKYFLEYNGAYNGSDKFGPEYRFDFFSAGAAGWMISEEPFMQSLGFLDMLKLRASYGEIGDDSSIGNALGLYRTVWEYGGQTSMDLNQGESPYTWYRVASIGNPDVRWETVKKLNYGADFAFFDGLLAGSIDIFKDRREDVLISGEDRSVPSYFGADPPAANLGEVEVKGYEAELRINKVLPNRLRLWTNMSMTHAKNEIIKMEEPQLLPDYQKDTGYSIGQSRAYVDAGFVNTYDELFATTPHDTNDEEKLVGDYKIIDFNGDGVIDSKDQIPYGYSETPQNTYNATIGFEWKGLSGFVQFYGVNNVTRYVPLNSFGSQLNTVYDLGSWWSKDNPNADIVVPRWMSTPSYHSGTQFLFDGSYVRLKNAEIAYTFDNNGWIKKIGFNSLRVFINGNNLWVWSEMPDDRESNFAGAGGQGAYPMMRRYNLGVKITL